MDCINFRWDLIGAKLAALSDDEQADFFKGFIREIMGYDSHYSREMQLMFIGDKLTNDDKNNLEKYFPCLWYKEGQ